jgi:hypothetical protein
MTILTRPRHLPASLIGFNQQGQPEALQGAEQRRLLSGTATTCIPNAMLLQSP